MVNVVNGEGVDGDDAGVSRPPCSAAEFCRTYDVTLILATPESKSHSRVSRVPSYCVRLTLPLRASRPPRSGPRGTRILGNSLDSFNRCNNAEW